jgi:hypothetical protein
VTQKGKSSRESKSEGVYLYSAYTVGAPFIDDDYNSFVVKLFVRSLLMLTHQQRCVAWQENRAFCATIRDAL